MKFLARLQEDRENSWKMEFKENFTYMYAGRSDRKNLDAGLTV